MMKDYEIMTQEECNDDEESELSIAAEFIMEHLPGDLKEKVDMFIYWYYRHRVGRCWWLLI